MYKKNIVVFTKYQNLSASVRHRFYAFNEILTKNNFEITYFPLFNDDFFKKKIFRNKINYFQLLLTYIKRFIQIFFYKKPFLAIIHFELFPYLPVIGEKILLFRNVPIIIDFDDAIFHQYENRNYILDKFYKRKFKKLFSLSYSVFAGNKYNKECAIQFGSKNVEYIPTVIDLEKYTKNSYNKLPNFTLVWIGSPSTAIYIKQILPILIKIQKLGVDIRLIGAGNINLPGLKFDLIEWDEDKEIKLLSECHLGIMPLPDDNWAKGKCGFKIIQYMGCSLPVIASPVGANKDIIVHGLNGFFANSIDDWLNYVKELKQNENLAQNMGKSGLKLISDKYSLAAWKNKYLNLVQKIYADKIK